MSVAVAPALHPALETALTATLPDAEQTLLLRACLLSGESARRAWAGYRARVKNLRRRFRDEPRSRRLAPLLSAALVRNGVAADPELLTVLRAAYTHEELRSRTYRRICREVFLALDVPFLVLKGAALDAPLYEDPALRHSHDLDLLLRPEDQARAHDALKRAGFLRGRPLHGAPVFLHESGLPVVLHPRLYRAHYAADFDELSARSEPGRGARVLSAADNLMHACVHASYCRGRSSLQWVCDAWHLARSGPDWDVVLETATHDHLVLPLYAALRYLATELDADVPAHVLDALGAAALRADACDRDVALFGARQGSPALPRETSWWTRMTLTRWLLFPSRRYVRRAYRVRRAPGLLLCYLKRPFTFLLGALWRRLPRPDVPTPEERLLLALAKVAPGPRDLAAARTARRAPAFSWDRALDLALHQGVQPLLARAVEADEEVPAAVKATLHRARLLSRLRVERFLDALAPVFDHLAARSVPIVLLKGAALAATTYPPGARGLNDLDVLIRRCDYEHVARALEAHGFVKVLSGRTEQEALRDYHEIEFQRRVGHEVLSVDVHWRVYPRDRAFELPLAEFLRGAVPVALGPLRALAPAPEATFVHIATQLTNDGFHVRVTRMADLHALVAGDLDWDRVVRLARRAAATGATLLGLRLAAMLGAEVPDDVYRRLARACPGARVATDLLADARLAFRYDLLRTAAVVALTPIYFGRWWNRFVYGLTLPLPRYGRAESIHPLRPGDPTGARSHPVVAYGRRLRVLGLAAGCGLATLLAAAAPPERRRELRACFWRSRGRS